MASLRLVTQGRSALGAMHGQITSRVLPVVVAALFSAHCLPSSAAPPPPRVPEDAVQAWVLSASDMVEKAEGTQGLGADRCTFRASVSPRNIVMHVPEPRDTGLQPGDKVVSIDGESVPDRDALTERLRQLGPQARIDIDIERLDRRERVQQPCVNAAPYEQSSLRIWKAIAARDWNGCMEAASASQSLSGPTPENTLAYLRCGVLSDRLTVAQFDLARYEFLRTTIEWNKWDPKGWPDARYALQQAMFVMEQTGGSSFTSQLTSLMAEADRMQPKGAQSPATTSSGVSRQPMPRGESMAFPALVSYRLVGEVVLGETTLREAIAMFPTTSGEGAPRRPKQLPPIKAGKVRPEPAKVFNPFATMYALYFDRNDRLVLLEELGNELEGQSLEGILSRYPALREVGRRRDTRELQGEIAPCVVLVLVVGPDDLVQAAAYAYTCQTLK